MSLQAYCRPTNEELRCTICGQKFKDAGKLEKHFEKLHKREMEKRQNARKHHKRFFADKEKLDRWEEEWDRSAA